MDTTTEATYKTGDSVRVRPDAYPKHHRTPWYIKGKVGKIATFSGMHFNAETRAYGESGLPRRPLYLVEFDQNDVWPQYDGPASDKILIDLFEHWLEPA